MLTAPLTRARIASRLRGRHESHDIRYYANGLNRRSKISVAEGTESTQNPEESNGTNEEGRVNQNSGKELSLYEQLFPDQQEATRRLAQRDAPKVPAGAKVVQWQPRQHKDEDGVKRSPASSQLKREMRMQGQQPTVLVLRNASTNLIEDDFRRLIPQGKHMEGWTLEQGDIVKIIPGRDLSTLEQQNYYFLLFSSAFSAFTYQGHATRVHQLAAANMPSSITSPMPPPPGYMIDGMEAKAAMESFTLVPPTQELSLRQLKSPLSPVMESIVNNGGYSKLLNRKDRMPFEVRLTLDGPQFHPNGISRIFRESGKDRGLSWSGDEEDVPRLTKWNEIAPKSTSSPMSRTPSSVKGGQAADMDQDHRNGTAKRHRPNGQVSDGLDDLEQQKRRTPSLIYIVGFRTEAAMQTFMRFWHRRPLAWEGVHQSGSEEGDFAPIVNVEMLW